MATSFFSLICVPNCEVLEQRVSEWVSVAWVLAPLEVCNGGNFILISDLCAKLWAKVVEQWVSNLSVAWVVCVNLAPLEFDCAMKIAKPSWKPDLQSYTFTPHLCFPVWSIDAPTTSRCPPCSNIATWCNDPKTTKTSIAILAGYFFLSALMFSCRIWNTQIVWENG